MPAPGINMSGSKWPFIAPIKAKPKLNRAIISRKFQAIPKYRLPMIPPAMGITMRSTIHMFGRIRIVAERGRRLEKQTASQGRRRFVRPFPLVTIGCHEEYEAPPVYATDEN